MVLLHDLSWPTSGLLALAVFFIYRLVCYIATARRMSRTGGVRGARLPSYVPWGLDFAVRTARTAMRNQNLENWQDGLYVAKSHTGEVSVMGRRIIITDDPENIKAVLATQFSDFGKGEDFHREWRPFLGDSIFATDGQLWHASRQLIRPQFIKDRVSDLHTFDEHLQTLFAVMAGCSGSDTSTNNPVSTSAHGRVIDISDLFFRYTLDVATDFLLGTDIQSLTIPRQEFAEAFNEVQRVQSLISRVAPLDFLVPRGSYNRGIRVIDEFVNLFIERALHLPPEELEKISSAAGGRYTFLHELARFTKDRKILRDQLVAVLIAGRDTTAATLSWAIYELSRHPECVRRLRAEIASVVGVENSNTRGKSGDNDETTVSSCRPPTYADLKAMRYLQHVINETLRMYPAVPFNIRRALKDTTLPRGGHGTGPNDFSRPLAVLSGTPIAYSTLAMQRRTDLYPSDLPGPGTFSPERWDHWQPKPWHYIPFNGGPRICIGQQFALTEMGYVLVRLFQKFERVVPHMDTEMPTMRSDIVLQPHDGVHVAFYESVA